MKKLICLTVLIVSLIVSCLPAADSTTQDFQSPEIKKAFRQYKVRAFEIEGDYRKDVKKAQDARDKATDAERDKLVKTLEKAKTAAMKAGDLDEAIKLRNAIKSLLAPPVKAKAKKPPKTTTGPAKAEQAKAILERRKKADRKKVENYIRAIEHQLVTAKKLNEKRVYDENEAGNVLESPFIKQQLVSCCVSVKYNLKRLKPLVQKESSNDQAITIRAIANKMLYSSPCSIRLTPPRPPATLSFIDLENASNQITAWANEQKVSTLRTPRHKPKAASNKRRPRR